jgi:GcrA cell cycle regulator
MTWTDARVAQLTTLWTAGVSASGIAEALGDVSRSAVLGKLHRLKLLGSRAAPSAPRRYDGPAPTMAAPPPPEAVAPRGDGPGGTTGQPLRSSWNEAAFQPLAGTKPAPWLAREAGACAFPVGGEGWALLSCCAPVAGRGAYCAAHRRIVFRGPGEGDREGEARRWVEEVARWAA